MFKRYIFCILMAIFSQSIFAVESEVETEESIRAETLRENRKSFDDVYPKIGITPAQQADWDAFYKAMTESQNMKALDIFFRYRKMEAPDLIQNLDMLAESNMAQAQDKKDFINAFEPLYRKLSAEPKKNVHDLFKLDQLTFPSGSEVETDEAVREKTLRGNQKYFDGMYAVMGITAEQQADWDTFYKAVTESRRMKALDIFSHYRKLEAPDLIQTFGMMADFNLAQAQDMKAFVKAFEPLYRKLSAEQKTIADKLFKNMF